MSIELGIALCALFGVIALFFGLGTLGIRVNGLEMENEILREQNKVHEKTEANLSKRIDLNSESCNQVYDLDTKVKISQKDIERALDMIEELKAKRSMDVLDKLREDDKK